MKKMILATNNQNKVREIREILNNTDIEVISLKEAGIDIDIEETGNTFKENARIKAQKIVKLANMPVLADDSGLEIDYLDGAPGIYSSRFMGENTPYEEKNKAIIEKLSNANENERGAAFICAMALILPDGREFFTEGKMSGTIAHIISGENGFGYDPIFYLPEFSKTSAQLTPEEKNKVSHRGKALRAMADIICREL